MVEPVDLVVEPVPSAAKVAKAEAARPYKPSPTEGSLISQPIPLIISILVMHGFIARIP